MVELRSPEWVRVGLRHSTGVDRAAVRRLVHHLDIFLPRILERLDRGVYPGLDDPLPPGALEAYCRDIADAYGFWSDRERIAQGELWPEVARGYRLPRAFGAGRQDSMVRLARQQLHACPTCLREW